MLKHSFRAAGLLVAASIVPTLWAAAPPNATPIQNIQNIVVIFQENNSFDHYFGAYPNALYASGEPVNETYPVGESPFVALPNTPSANGIHSSRERAVSGSANPAFPTGPGRRRLPAIRTALTKAEQNAYNSGAVNLFPANASQGIGSPTPRGTYASRPDHGLLPISNTVTALSNYAQYFAMSDNYFDTEFGVTEEGHFQNLISGQLTR